MVKISLVIPCWHVAKHMPHVLKDLQAQTFKDFEAILVNDGDDSQVASMEEIAAQDSRIRIVRLEKNSGASAARNAGTNVAKAPWVGYADPDDRFGPHYLQSLYEAVDGTGAEMGCGGYMFHYMRTGKDTRRYINIDNSPLVVDIAKGYELMSAVHADYYVWNKLYSIDVIRKHGLSYNNYMLTGEDDVFNLKYFLCIEKVGVVKNCEYCYCFYDSETLCHRYDPRYMTNAYELLTLRVKFRRDIHWPEQRIFEERNKELVYNSFRMCSRLFSYHSPLTFGGAVKKIQEEILDQPEIVHSILQGNYERDRMIRLHQKLVRIGNARLMALTFKILWIGKKNFGNFYAKIKPFFRGD